MRLRELLEQAILRLPEVDPARVESYCNAFNERAGEFQRFGDFPMMRRGTCPQCGSRNLHAMMTRSEFEAELKRPMLLVLCRVCPDLWVAPRWDVEPSRPYKEHAPEEWI